MTMTTDPGVREGSLPLAAVTSRSSPVMSTPAFVNANSAGWPQTTSNASTNASGHPGVIIKRVELPQFSGEAEDYWQFREVFLTLIDELYIEHATHASQNMLYIMQLKNQLPTVGNNMVRGAMDRHKAWKVLNLHYGDRNAAVVSIISRL